MWKCNLLTELEHYWYPRNDVFDTIKVGWKFEREIEQNSFEHQKETFERSRFCRFNTFCFDEATLANNVLFSKDVLSGYVDRKEAPSKRWQLKTYLTTAKEKSGKSKDVCYLCQNDHDLDKCQDCNKVNSSFKRSCVMDVICQYQKIIIYGAVNKGECVILVVKNIQLVYMAIKIVRKKKMHLVATHRRVIALWHVQQVRWNQTL